ncbi:MAG: LPXTG cell wall anchor domain-containing protein [Rubrobacteraceae bacterium]
MEDRVAVRGMRLGVVFAAMAAMMAFALVASAPAFGQATAVDEGDDVTIEDSFNTICPQVVTAVGEQNNYGDANAGAIADSEAAAAVAQDFDISVAQVNQCLSGADGGDDGGEPAGRDQYENPENGDDNDTEDNIIDSTIPNQKLPDTGGMPLSGLLVVGFALICAGAAILRDRR